MPLTPEDVSNKRFTPVRLREGYDMGEVDQFLDEVEAELERLLKENDDLRTKLTSSHGADAVDAVTAAQKTGARGSAGEGRRQGRREGPKGRPTEPGEVQDAPVATPTPAREEIKVVTPAEASSAALRLLELATRNADEVERMAKDDAEKLLSDARAEAERLEAETKATTDRLEQEARERAQMLDSETEAKRSEALGDIERQKAALDGEVENLRAFEREYRSRLKTYFSQQLQALDGNGEGGQLPGERRRARVLGSPRSPGTRGASTPTASDAPGRPEARAAQTRWTLNASPRSASACSSPSASAASVIGGGQHLAGDQVTVLADGLGQLARCVPAEGDPVRDLEAARLAGLLDHPHHLARLAGAHAAPGSARGRGRPSRPAR